MPQSDAASPRRLTVVNHPIYSTLLPVPIVCFLGALIADLVYSRMPDMLWIDFASWLLLAGVIAGVVAGLVLLVELVRAGQYRGPALLVHFLLLLAAWVVEVFNSFVHSRDGWTAVVPAGLILSFAACLLALAAGWFWQSASVRLEARDATV